VVIRNYTAEVVYDHLSRKTACHNYHTNNSLSKQLYWLILSDWHTVAQTRWNI